MAELLARLRVLERRLSTVKSAEICIGDVVLDTTTHYVSLLGRGAELPRKEYMLLKLLMENAGRVQARTKLENPYSWDEEVASNALEVHVHQLRKNWVPILSRLYVAWAARLNIRDFDSHLPGADGVGDNHPLTSLPPSRGTAPVWPKRSACLTIKCWKRRNSLPTYL